MAVNIVSRESAEALIHDQLMTTVFQEAPKNSIVMQLGRKLPNMTSKQTRVPVLSMLPMAYWVGGDTGMKQTSRQQWENVYITAGELAVIVPIPEAVLEDASFDIMGEVIPRVNESIGMKFDEAAIFGGDRPPEWQNDIITLARQAGNNVSGGITFDTIMGQDGMFGKVEEAGYIVDGVIAAMRSRAALRGIKDDTSRPIFMPSMQDRTRYMLDGAPVYFPENGCFDPAVAQMVAGNWRQLVWAMRQDIETKILDQAVIQDPSTKEIVYNLAQQDMIALRVTFRAGFAVPNPATRLNSARTLVPFAYIEPGSPAATYTATFTVKDSGGNIKDAEINLNGSILRTNESGQAVFNLRNGEYPYVVKADGYRKQTGTVAISSGAQTPTITLVKTGT
ncbi:MAG: phage major capsid protein [Gemmiger sp.]|uniref:phage major capsid protein n=1 Tax=Gemmiger sp. TaxID=2049027 RepID=UPI002E79C4B5|nr:phage major capsid protein [Gemmiger sp.]MEE0709909.1 phage major capsid protein [Gemmiger sp.]